MASTTVVLGACKPCEQPPPPPDPSDATAPILIEGRFTEPGVVELVFSEPLAPPDGVDPKKFRLSAARGMTDEYRTGCLASTDYCDLSLGLGDYACNRCGSYYGDDDDCPDMIEVASLELREDDPTRLVLGLSAPIRPLLCLQIDYAGDDAGIMVHYSSRDIPTVTSTDGTRVEDIAPLWVLEGERDDHQDALFPARDAFVAIRCPEDFG